MQSKSPAPPPAAPVRGIAARELALRAGGLAMLRFVNRGRARIIAYHRFPASSAELLRTQCRYLREFHRVVSLDEIDRWLCKGQPLPPYAMAVTVDDGYRDFYRVAYPIFREYGIPVTVFLATGFLDGACWLWCDMVAHLFRNSAVEDAEIRVGEAAFQLSLRSEAERAAASSTVKEAAKRLDDDSRVSLVYNVLPTVLRVSLPATPPPEYEPLTWDEVREMCAGGIRFGAHTHTHPILSRLKSEARLTSEILTSKRRIEAELGHPVAHFAYPNGCLPDVNPDVVRAVKKAGYTSAFMAEPGANGKMSDRYTLLRNTTEPAIPMPFFGRTILR